MSLVEPGLAFLEGLALIVSPCILPVLPLVLSASVEGGRKRPFGIITGFVLAFSAFALLSRALVSALHIDLDLIKDASLILLALFGLVLLSSTLSAKFNAWTQGAASLGGRLSQTGKEGYFSGVMIGALIGLVWTPCAGPILAAVLVTVIRQQSNLGGIFTIAAFALGAGVPMLIIALVGRKFMDRMGFFKAHAEGVRKAFGVIILLAVAFLASGVDAQALFAPRTSQTKETTGLEDALPAPYPAPEFTGINAWLNSPPLTMAGLQGKVVLVDFWTYSCINCVRTLPYLTAWDAKYRDKGLVIVGVHAPEFEFEKNEANVTAALAQYGIHYPVALDNGLNTWLAFNNQYWPAHYLIDRQGNVVYTHFGEGHYDVTENNIRYLLGLKGSSEQMPLAAQPYSAEQTPETYLGYARMQGFSGTATHDAAADYAFPRFLPLNAWSLSGSWRIEKDKIVSAAKNAGLRLNFKARKVFLVLGAAADAPVNLSLTLNGEAVGGNAGADAPGGKLTVSRHALYALIDQKTAKNSLLELTADAPGLEAYAFTFGD